MRRSVQIGYKTVSEVLVRAMSFLVVVLSARLLDKEGFGIFSLAWTAGWILSVSTDFGLQLYLTREVARHPRQSREIFRCLLQIRICLAVCLFALLGVACVWSDWPAQIIPFLILVGAQIGTSLIEFFNYFYRGLSRSELESSINLLHRVLALASVAFLLWVYPTVSGLAMGLALATALTLAGTAALSMRVAELPGGTHEGRMWRRKSVGSLFFEVFPIGAGILLSVLYFRIDLFLIEWWKGTESVALYNSVFRLVEALRLFPAAVLAVVFPELCRDFSWRTLAWTCLGLSSLGLVLTVILATWADVLVQLVYGQTYAPAAPTLKVLLLAVPLLFANFVLTHQLMAWNLQRFYAFLCAGGLLCNVVLNWFLIPRFSIQGAAWATLATELFLAVGCILVLGRKGAQHVPLDSGGEPLTLDAL